MSVEFKGHKNFIHCRCGVYKKATHIFRFQFCGLLSSAYLVHLLLNYLCGQSIANGTKYLRVYRKPLMGMGFSFLYACIFNATHTYIHLTVY